MKQSTIKYNEFSKVSCEPSIGGEYATVFLTTKSNRYRLTKYLADIERANSFVNEVNHWWTVVRMEQKQKMYNNRMLMIRRYSNLYSNSPKSVEEKKEEEEEVEEKTEEDIYWEDCEELGILIKKLKYKSFAERDVEYGCKLKEYFDTKYRVKMVEEYQNIKKEMEQKKLKKDSIADNDQELQMILKHPDQYIASALLLKVDTVDRLIQHRKVSKSMMELESPRSNESDETKLREEVHDEGSIAEEV